MRTPTDPNQHPWIAAAETMGMPRPLPTSVGIELVSGTTTTDPQGVKADTPMILLTTATFGGVNTVFLSPEVFAEFMEVGKAIQDALSHTIPAPVRLVSAATAKDVFEASRKNTFQKPFGTRLK